MKCLPTEQYSVHPISAKGRDYTMLSSSCILYFPNWHEHVGNCEYVLAHILMVSTTPT